MKNQENWDFAQKKWSREFIFGGLVMMICGGGGLLLPGTEIWMVGAALAIMTAILLFFSYRTERALKNFEKK